jgi:hypothetical protein
LVTIQFIPQGEKMKLKMRLFAVLLIGLFSIQPTFAAEDTVQFTLEIVAENQVTLTSITQAVRGLNAIEAINQVVIMGIKNTDWGPMIVSLASVEAVGNTYWALFVNGEMSMVGAQDVILDVDTIIRLILTAF